MAVHNAGKCAHDKRTINVSLESSSYLNCGEPFQAWEMWLSPHSEKPVGSEVGGQDPRPGISSSVGNQACIVPRLLWDLLLLKLPHPEARKCLLSIFIFLKSGLDLPCMEPSSLDHFALYIANILLWCIQQHPLPCLQKITTQNKPLHSKRAPSLIYWAKKNNKTLSRQGSVRSPLEGVAQALRSTLLLREWPRHPFSPHRTSVVPVYVYLNIETTMDPAGQDSCH